MRVASVKGLPFYRGKMLTVKIESGGLLDALQRAPALVASELRQGMRQSLKVVQDDARQNHRFRTGLTGRSEKSISVSTDVTGLQGKVFLNTGIAPYSVYQHEGTGLYGYKHKAITIVPVHRKSLHWVRGGNDNFAKEVLVKGIHPDKFLNKALMRQYTTIKTILRDAVHSAIKAAGL